MIAKMFDELHDLGFVDRIRISALTINPDDVTRDLNVKGHHKRRVSATSHQVISVGLPTEIQGQTGAGRGN